MRITKLQLKPEEIKEIEALTDQITSANKDITLACDFSKDAYALFKEKVNKRKIFKSFWEIFKDIRTQYTKFKMMDLMKNVDFYGRVRNFFRYFIISGLFHELDKLDPIEALETFLKMFQPPQQQQPSQKPPQASPNASGTATKGKDDQSHQKQQPSRKQKRKSQQKDQGGRSANESNLPIDMTEFKQNLPKIEKALDSGILDKEDFQNYLEQHAGIGHSQIQLGNIVNLIDKIAKNLSQRELDIFYVARHKEVTERYRRDEVIESVPYPDNEMSVKNIDNPMEILKLVPTQYAYDDNIFMQKLIRKELLVRDYQSRRLKRQALYLLIDVSGSMSGSKNVYASGVALSLVRQAIDEGSTYFLRFFDDTPHDLIKITTKQDAINICDTLIKQPFSGGGTSIQTAINTAIDDITKSPEQFEKSEIMVITDGEDTVGLDPADLKNIKIHSTLIDGENRGLKVVSTTYRELKSVDF